MNVLFWVALSLILAENLFIIGMLLHFFRDCSGETLFYAGILVFLQFLVSLCWCGLLPIVSGKELLLYSKEIFGNLEIGHIFVCVVILFCIFIRYLAIRYCGFAPRNNVKWKLRIEDNRFMRK